MGQTAKEEADIAMWNALRDAVQELDIGNSSGMKLGEVTATLAQRGGFGPEKVMGGLLEGVRQGELLIEDDRVKLARPIDSAHPRSETGTDPNSDFAR